MRRYNKLTKCRGFTFVELMITVATISIIGIIFFSAFLGSVQFLSIQETNVELQSKARSAMSLVTREIESAVERIDINRAADCANNCTWFQFDVPLFANGGIEVTGDPPAVALSGNPIDYAMACTPPMQLQRARSGNVRTLTDYVANVQFVGHCVIQPCPPCTDLNVREDEIRVVLTLRKAIPLRPNHPLEFTLTNIVKLRNDNVLTTAGGGGPPPPPPPHCLLAKTKITLPNGLTKAIEDIKAGDMVLGYKNGKLKIVKVTKTFFHPKEKEYYILETNDGRKVKLTGNHPILRGKKYVEARKLKEGDTIRVLRDDKLTDAAVKKITKKIGPVDVYNIAVDTTHNYFAEGILMHNKPQQVIIIIH